MQLKYVLRFWRNVDNKGPDECWLWLACTDRHGRGVMTVHVDGKPFNLKAPRIAFWDAHGRWPAPDKFILHSCDTPLCCNPAHLREGTPADNMRDALARDRVKRGSGHGQSKLTESDIPTIRRLSAEGWSQDRIAERFGVSRGPIKAILGGWTWKHVP
jgi:hypothetical protein